MDAKWKQELETHVSECSACKEFVAAVGKSAFEPFLKSETQRPSEQVWSSIKERILVEQYESPSLLTGFWNNLQNALTIPKPALAFAMVFLLIIGAGTMTQVTGHKKVETQDQVEYFAQVIDADLSANDESEYGTSVEQYFL
jgi:hypothetical protein